MTREELGCQEPTGNQRDIRKWGGEVAGFRASIFTEGCCARYRLRKYHKEQTSLC